MSGIHTGLAVEFIYYSDYLKEIFHAMRSHIYDVAGKKMILAQSVPIVLPSHLKRDILMTYLQNKDSHYTRLGFKAKIIDIIDQYEIEPGKLLPAIVVEQSEAPQSVNLRIHFRLQLPYDSGLTMQVNGDHANIIDISIGGAKIILKIAKKLAPQDRLKLKLCIDDREFSLEAGVLRAWPPMGEESRKDLYYVTMQFLNAGTELAQILGRKIFSIERKLLADGKKI